MNYFDGMEPTILNQQNALFYPNPPLHCINQELSFDK